MKIACPSCSAKYSIADEKVHNRLAKIRCRKCGTTIVIDGKSNPPAVHAASGGSSVHPQATTVSHAPAASVGPGLSSYTVDLSEHDQPTMTVDEIVHAYNTGAITADTYVWRDGMADWAPLADVPEINEALHRAASSHPPAAAAPAYVAPAASAHVAPAAPAFVAQSPVFPTAAAREPVRAAARTEGRAADLFGGIDIAGSEKDLGTGGGQETGHVTTATTGARNESSVLFSLSALTASEQRGSSKGTDDSGLIDLAALTSASAADAAHSVDLGASPFGGLGSSPLGTAPLLSGGTTSPLGDPTAHAPAPNRNGLYIGGGIAVAAVVAGLVYLLKEEPPVASAVIPTATVVVTATIAAPPLEAPDTQGAKAEDDSKAEDDKQAAAPKKAAPARRAPAATPKASDDKPAASKDPAPADKAKPAPAPKKSTCNCAPSDLMCNMKCSAK